MNDVGSGPAADPIPPDGAGAPGLQAARSDAAVTPQAEAADAAAVASSDGGQPDAAWGQARAVIPAWLVNLAALGWRVIAIAAFVVVLWALASVMWTVTASVAVATVVAAAFAPFALALRARGRSRTTAAAIVWVVALAVVGGALLLLTLLLVPDLVATLQRLTAGVSELKVQLADAGVPPAVGQAASDATDAIQAAVGSAVSGIVASAAGAVTVLILAAFLVFFFLQDGDRAWVWAFQAVSDQKRERITEAGDDALQRVGGYLRGTTVLSAITAATDFVFMWLLGVPLAVPLSVLVFLFGYVPYFGGLISTLLIVLVTLGSLGTGPAVLIFVLMAVRTAILGYLVRPAVYGLTVSIHPAVVLMALPAGFEVAGIIGLFAAVPVAAVLLAVSRATIAIIDPGPRPELPPLVPAWIDRLAQWSWRLLVALGLLALAALAIAAVPLVLVPVILGTIFAATLDPLVGWLMRGGRSRRRAAAMATGGTFLAITAVVSLTMLSLMGDAAAISDQATRGAQSASDAAGGTLGLLTNAVQGSGRELVQTLLGVASAIGGFVVGMVLSVLLAFYFLADGGTLWRAVLARTRPQAATALDSAGHRAFDVLSGYMIGTGAVSLVGAGSQLAIMVLLGIPLALPIFVLSFFLCFIPYFGGFISTGLAFLVTVATGTPADVAIMAIWTVVFNIVQGNIVAPLVYGRTVHLHPAVVLVACPAGAAFGGLMGMFLVVPVCGVVAATWRPILALIGMPRPAREPPAGT